ncbi:hypothetical protein J2S55_008869 [Streptosporangium brasiliense]|uniref:Uncharacterized protein n=1 Tax=Streptosporangium brasiliense TaxID=47480 RepID=A0ABT9RKJ6_9ACTN|nr:hypothetical protein [Streptosporangium brasiliense]
MYVLIITGTGGEIGRTVGTAAVASLAAAALRQPTGREGGSGARHASGPMGPTWNRTR